MSMIRAMPLSLVCTAVLAGCAWVKLTEQGRSVRVGTFAEVTGCQRLGDVTASVVDKVVFIKRSRDKQAEELEALARNEAGETDGNVIVATGDINEGRREYTIYRCN